jgi:O-antigen/teichoic acid export membrane protein
MRTDADLDGALSAADDAYERQRRGTQQLLLARGVFFASAYVVTAILTRQLGPTAYGIYGVIISQLMWLKMVVNAGVPAATSKLMADGQHHPRDVARAAQTLLFSASIVVFLVCWVLAPAVAALMRIPDGAPLFRIAIIDLPFAAIYASYEGILAGGRRFGVMAIAQIAYGVLRVAAIVAVAAFGLSIERALLATVFSSVAICIIMGIRYPPSGFRLEPRTVKEIAGFAGPLAVCLVAGQVLINLDLWSLQSLWTGSGEVVGQYVASVNLARILAVIPAGQAGVLFASVAWASASRDNVRAVAHIHEASRFAIVVAGGACVVLGMNGAEVLSFLFSSAYAEGQRFLPLQLLGFGLFAVVDVFAHALMAAGRQLLVAVVLTSIVPLVWLGNYLLIPRLGPVGAAMSLVLGVAVGAAVTGTLARMHFGALRGWSTVLRVLAASAVTALASAAVHVPGALILIKLAALGAVYLLTLYLLGEVTPQSLRLRVRSSGNVP